MALLEATDSACGMKAESREGSSAQRGRGATYYFGADSCQRKIEEHLEAFSRLSVLHAK
jgi:YHS domain-containing protein